MVKRNIMKRLFAYNPDIKQSWKLVIYFILCYQIAGGAVSVVLRETGAATKEWASLAGSLTGFAIVTLIVIRSGKGANNVHVTTPGLSPFLWFLLVPFTLSVSLAALPPALYIPMPDVIKQMITDMPRNNLPGFLEIVVLAPVCEEWLYRGIILKGLLARYTPLKAIIWSSVIFSAVHLNPWQTVSAFCGALAIGWIYWRTRSLWYCIFMHMVNNVMGFLFLVFFADTPYDITMTELTNGCHIYLYVAILIIGILSWKGIKNILSSGTAAEARG